MDYWHDHDVNDTYPKRWMIAPYKNDGRPYLLTAWFWGNSVTVGGVYPPDTLIAWDVPPEELKGKDWNLADSYIGYHSLFAPWSGADDTYEYKFIDELYRYLSPTPRLKKTRCHDPSYPKIEYPANSQSLSESEKFRGWGRECGRSTGGVQVALSAGRYYLIYPDYQDRILVVDASKTPGDDECYLGSEITGNVDIRR